MRLEVDIEGKLKPLRTYKRRIAFHCPITILGRYYCNTVGMLSWNPAFVILTTHSLLFQKYYGFHSNRKILGLPNNIYKTNVQSRMTAPEPFQFILFCKYHITVKSLRVFLCFKYHLANPLSYRSTHFIDSTHD